MSVGRKGGCWFRRRASALWLTSVGFWLLEGEEAGLASQQHDSSRQTY